MDKLSYPTDSFKRTDEVTKTSPCPRPREWDRRAHLVVHRSVFYSSAAHLALASKACSVRFSRCPPGCPSALRRCCDANEHITRIFTACQRISESFLRNFSEGRQGPERGTRKASGRGPARGSPCGLRKPPGVPPGRLPLRAHDAQNRPLCWGFPGQGCANYVCAPTERSRSSVPS